jgi:hypothetical protein
VAPDPGLVGTGCASGSSNSDSSTSDGGSSSNGGGSPSGIDYETAFQAKDGNLWTVGSDQHGDWGFRLAPGTSPSIAR